MDNSGRISPKLLHVTDKRKRRGPSSWYSYYAGYAPDFVGDILGHIPGSKAIVVCDPWNGSGTTTQVAHESGFLASGYDINPAMVVVAKARLLGATVSPSELALAHTILEHSRTQTPDIVDDDPLLTWLAPQSASLLRRLERSVCHCLVGKDEGRLGGNDVSRFSSLAAFFYLALFRVTRSVTDPFRPSNPTWIRRTIPDEDKLRFGRVQLERRFLAQVRSMVSVAKPRKGNHTTDAAEHQSELPEIVVASSTAIPREDSSVDVVVSSPPYCTRIDYAVATAPELAVLEIGGSDFRQLRESMIGTSTIGRTVGPADPAWGKACNDFLERVAVHPSKASGGYYLKTHLQYFDALYRSLVEIERVTKPGSTCVLVVQDSYYKNLHNDLPQVVREMGASLGWGIRQQHSFPATHLMTMLHSTSRSYRRTTHAAETVLEFETGSPT